jgi:hypothetical protein
VQSARSRPLFALRLPFRDVPRNDRLRYEGSKDQAASRGYRVFSMPDEGRGRGFEKRRRKTVSASSAISLPRGTMRWSGEAHQHPHRRPAAPHEMPNSAGFGPLSSGGPGRPRVTRPLSNWDLRKTNSQSVTHGGAADQDPALDSPVSTWPRTQTGRLLPPAVDRVATFDADLEPPGQILDDTFLPLEPVLELLPDKVRVPARMWASRPNARSYASRTCLSAVRIPPVVTSHLATFPNQAHA